MDVPQGQVQPFWGGVPIPENLPPGLDQLSAKLTVQARGRAAQERTLTLKLKAGRLQDHGDSRPASYSRLRWLNSTTGRDNQPTKDYPALAIEGKTIRCLGREVELDETGLPARITTFFNAANTRIESAPQRELLKSPLSLVGVLPDGQVAKWKPAGFSFTRRSGGVVEWASQWVGSGLEAKLSGQMEFDGSLQFRLALAARQGVVKLRDVRLEILRTPETTRYALGLQLEAGLCPSRWSWRWDVAHRNQDSIWLGAVNGGLRVRLKADNYVAPAINTHYRDRPLNDPPSWSGGGMGGMEFRRDPSPARLSCYSGPRTLVAGKPLHFNFDLLVTPFHPLRTREQWQQRYYQTHDIPRNCGRYLDKAKAQGANIINVHQGNWVNPYINYPFRTWHHLRDFSQAAHDRKLRAKYYYTVRELSNWCTELFALHSLNGEVLLPGKGGGHPWAEEHLGGGYCQGWYEPRVHDVSLLTQPLSRWNNYYVEGLRWLCENTGCDGVYIDDIECDHAIMTRMRKVLDRYCPRGGLIDLHSWNEYQPAGAWAHCANLYMEIFPFVNRLWFGEAHQYSGPPPEHFLVGISGIPFGLMGEMLQGGGNPWLGLVFGCTARLGWGGDPRPVWKLWDDFGVQDAQFIGWWAGPDCPVHCNDPQVKVSVWQRQHRILVAVGNFAKTQKTVVLQLDWQRLGLDPHGAKRHAPSLPKMGQKRSVHPATQPFTVKSYAGAAFVLR